MGTVASLNVKIGADAGELRKEIDNVNRLLKQKFGSKFLNMSRGIVTGMSAIGAALAGVGAMAIRTAAQMEQTEKAFETLMRDSQLAKTYLDELSRFAANTPFSLPGVLDASKRLLAFGFTAQQSIPMLTTLGDTASALGLGEEGIMRLTLAIGQMAAKGKVSAEEMMQLTDAGVAGWDILASHIGVGIPQAMAMAEKGMINSATGVQALLSGMNKRYGGMMKEQSMTFNGMLSNIMDSVGQAMTVVGDEIIEGLNLKPALKIAMDALGGFTDSVKRLGLGETMREAIPEPLIIGLGALAGIIVASALPALASMALSLAGMVATFIAATGPIGIAVAAIGAGAAYVWKHWDWCKANMEYLTVAISESFTIMTSEIKLEFANMVDSAAAKLDILFSLVDISSSIAKDAQKWAEETQRSAEAAIESAKRAKAEAADALTWVNPDSQGNGLPDIAPEFKAADIDNLGLKSQPPMETGKEGGKAGKIKEAETALHDYLSVWDEVVIDEANGINMLAQLDEERAIKSSDYIASAHEQRMGLEEEFNEFVNSNSDTMLSQFSNNMAQAVMQGNNLGKTLQNIGKNIVTMFLTWMIQRKAQSALDSMLKKKEEKENKARASSEAESLVDPAIQRTIADVGPLAAPGVYTASVSTLKGIGLSSIVAKADGGYISGPGTGTSDSIPAMLSDGEYVVRASAVDNVGLPFLNALNSGHIPGGGVSSIVVTNNNYGDINTGVDYDEYMTDINESVARGLGGVSL